MPAADPLNNQGLAEEKTTCKETNYLNAKLYPCYNKALSTCSNHDYSTAHSNPEASHLMFYAITTSLPMLSPFSDWRDRDTEIG